MNVAFSDDCVRITFSDAMRICVTVTAVSENHRLLFPSFTPKIKYVKTRAFRSKIKHVLYTFGTTTDGENKSSAPAHNW